MQNDDNTSPFYCLNRDLSWVDFNGRVLEEGLRKDLPLLERFRFLSIVSSNFDEFFMVRVAALKHLVASDTLGFSVSKSGYTAAQQLEMISDKVHSLMERQYKCIRDEIFPGLAKNGLSILRPDSCQVPQLDFLNSFFIGQIYPVLTPLRLEDNQPLPFIENKLLHAAFLLEPDQLPGEVPQENKSNEVKVIVPLPAVLNRIIWLPDTSSDGTSSDGTSSDGASNNDTLNGGTLNDRKENDLQLILLEDVIITWSAYLFPGYKVKETMLFKIDRDADFSVDERRDEDFIEAMSEVLEGREISDVVRMVYSKGSNKLRDDLARCFSLTEAYLYEADGPINPMDLMELANVSGLEEQTEKPWKIYPTVDFNEDVPIWDRISQGDVMLHFPYQSFDPVVRFFQDAANDSQVISIKTALYRTGGAIPGTGINSGSSVFSPVVRALEQAALNGKHVTAVVELKARFDEIRNISWANRLEKAGVIVVYGLSNIKVHSKISMVMRRENDRIKRYVHISTGNYNDRTARYYEDICLFTSREDIAYDAGILFNMLTGYSSVQRMIRLTIAPSGLKKKFLELIEREENRSRHKYPSKIMAKLNSLTDIDIIKGLYSASTAGVHISLCIRGICTLIPGIPGISDNIKVISIIDHYLEHSRMYYFANGGAEELYLSSSDWMPRNLERRVELLFPVQDEKIKSELLDVLGSYFNDNCQASSLDKDGIWTHLNPSHGEKPFRIQKELLSRAERDSVKSGPVKLEYIVRRSPPAEKI